MAEAFTCAADGRIVYRFRKPWRNGKQAVVMDPMTFLSRLAAQVPPRRIHLLSYYGVLAPAAYRRKEIVPRQEVELKPAQDGGSERQQELATSKENVMRPQPWRMRWADLIKRVFLEDVLACPCGGRRRVLAMVFDSESIERILRYEGLPWERPVRAPPRKVQGVMGY